MAGVLALDIATVSGWAFWHQPGGRIEYGSYRIPDGGKIGRRVLRFGFWLDGMMKTLQPSLMVYEAPLLRQDPKSPTPIRTARLLMSLATQACVVAEGRGVPYEEDGVNNQTVRKHFLGSARGVRAELKDRTMAVCKALGWSPQNDNVGDALAILHWALHRYRYDHTLPTTAMFYARPAEDAA